MKKMDTGQIRDILKLKLGATAVEVVDESGRHAGHAGAAQGSGHYRVTIVSDAFTSKSPLERHRMVYAALENEMGRDLIHALAIKTLAPHER